MLVNAMIRAPTRVALRMPDMSDTPTRYAKNPRMNTNTMAMAIYCGVMEYVYSIFAKSHIIMADPSGMVILSCMSIDIVSSSAPQTAPIAEITNIIWYPGIWDSDTVLPKRTTQLPARNAKTVPTMRSVRLILTEARLAYLLWLLCSFPDLSYPRFCPNCS